MVAAIARCGGLGPWFIDGGGWGDHEDRAVLDLSVAEAEAADLIASGEDDVVIVAERSPFALLY